MKKLLSIAVLLTVVACNKTEPLQYDDCYVCTDIERYVENGVTLYEKRIASYNTLVPDTDTLRTSHGQGELLRFMDCVKK